MSSGVDSSLLDITFVVAYREVQHINVVRFIGACTKPPDFCIVTGMFFIVVNLNNVVETPCFISRCCKILTILVLDLISSNGILHKQ